MLDYKKSFGALLGNTMQFYDFTLYAFLAPQIKQTFFDFDNTYLSYLVVFGVFACGYLTRPIGALLFGYLGDKKGRSYSLSMTIILATVTTFLIGLIPGYNALGLLSPALLLLLRLIQGIAVSGEEGSAVVLLFERYAFQHQRIIGAAVLSSVFVGLLLGIVVCVMTEQLVSLHILNEWFWRLPFLLALPLGGIAAYLRYYLNDFNLFALAEKNNLVVKKPVRSLLKKYWPTIIFGFFIVASYSVTTSTIIVHLPYYLTTILGYSQTDSLLVLSLAIILMMLLSPLFAKFFEQFPVFEVYKWALLGTIVLSPWLFYMFESGSMVCVMISIALFSILTAIITSTIFALLVTAFPFGIRCSGVSLSFNLSITVFSSSTPIVLLCVEHHFASNYAPGLYLSGLLSVFLLATSWLRRTSWVDLNTTQDEALLYQTHWNNFYTRVNYDNI